MKVVKKLRTEKKPDGSAYAAPFHKLYVSDERGKAEAIVDVTKDEIVKTLHFDSETGMPQYDPVARKVYVNLQDQNIFAANRLLRSKGVGGEILEILAEIDPGSAAEVGLKVRKGPTEETVIGVDTIQTQLFVDRTRSGNGAFDQKFPGRHVAPTHLAQGKSVRLHLFVDQSSVEVFGNDGEAVISDCIFPARSSQAIEVYSRGGEARITKLDVWKLRSAWQ